MKKLTATSVILLAVLTLSTSNLFAAEKGTNKKDSAKETKELLKFSVNEFTGTEDSEAATLESLPADTNQPAEKNNSDSIVKPTGKTQNATEQHNSVN